jgi:hypothetical protein
MSITQSNSLSNYFYTDLGIPEYNITDSFSISFWTNFSTYPLKGDIIYYGSLDGSIKNYSIHYESNINFDGNNFWDASFNNDGWHHYVLTFNQGNVDLYIDGVKSLFSYSNASIGNTPNQKLVIGKIESVDIAATGFIGYYDDIYLYNRILSLQEINLLYDLNTVGIFESSTSKLDLVINYSTQQIKSNEELKSISIYNSLGQQITIAQNINSISFNKLNQGLYYVKSISKSNKVSTLKLLKK